GGAGVGLAGGGGAGRVRACMTLVIGARQRRPRLLAPGGRGAALRGPLRGRRSPARSVGRAAVHPARGAARLVRAALSVGGGAPLSVRGGAPLSVGGGAPLSVGGRAPL